MRQSIALVFLIVAGCSGASKADTGAAREFILRLYPQAEFLLVEEPEYAAIHKFPIGSGGNRLSDKSAACGVRIRYRVRDEGRTMTDDCIVWVTSNHKGINWCGNGYGDNWRRYVRSFAKK